jgi:hypothetical protein
VRFDTDVRQHSAQDDLAQVPLTELRLEIVGLRTADFARTDHDGLPILYIGREAI